MENPKGGDQMDRSYRGARMTIVLLIALLGTLSCVASRSAYEQQLASWVGATEAELVNHFGPPERREEGEDGQVTLFYSSTRGEMVGSGPTPVSSNVSVGVSSLVEHVCELSFRALDDLVTGFEWSAIGRGAFGEVQPFNSGECGVAFPAEQSDQP